MTDETIQTCPVCHHPAESHPEGISGIGPFCTRGLGVLPSCWDCYTTQGALAMYELDLYGQVLTTKFPGFFHVMDPEPDDTPPALPDWQQALYDATETYRATIRAAQEFTDAMERLTTEIGVSPDQISNLKDNILQMARISGQSATDTALMTLEALRGPTQTIPHRSNLPPRPPKPATPPTAASKALGTHVTVIRLGNGYAWQCTRQTTRECCN